MRDALKMVDEGREIVRLQEENGVWPDLPAILLDDRWVVFQGGASRRLGLLECFKIKLGLQKTVARKGAKHATPII